MNEPEVTSLADLARTPAERAASAVPWAGITVWTAAEIMHWASWPGMTPEASMAAVAAFGITFGVGAHKGWGWKAPAVVAAFAVWLALASARGPLDGFPVPSLTVVWAVLTGIAWRLASLHPSILEAIRWRAARAEWLAQRHRWHLPGSHLLGHEETRLGERFTVDVRESGKLASAVARDSALPERIAMDRGIPRSRVTVAEGTPAGRVVIDIRDRDPWADPIPHPATVSGHEVELSPSPSITEPAAVGQDPATGKLLSLLLCGPGGGRNINVVATIDSGKTVLLSDISEFVTRAPDALMIRINVSIKGPAEAHLWGPACHLTAFGPHQRARALKVLKVVAGIVEWRASQPKERANWLPTKRDPHVVLIIDEIDSLTEVAALRKALEMIATKGREYGVTVVRAGQRGTAEDTGGAKVRAVDGVWCLGSLNRSTEAMHAAGDLGLRLPDVASYGEGNPGVWIIAEKSGRWQGGRAWNLCEPADIAGIAAARASSQPDLPEACKEFLGDEYAALAGSDVYARWARDRDQESVSAPSPAARHAGDGGLIGDLARAVRDGHVKADPETEEALLQALSIAEQGAGSDLDRLRAYEPEVEEILDDDDDLRRRFGDLGRKLADQRAILEETARMPEPPKVPEEKLKESSEERWRQVGEQAEMSPEQRETLLGLLKDGTTTSNAAKVLGVSTWIARTYLQKLRNEKVARVDGKGRGARWRLTEDGDPQ
jgi:hypothetical protein